MSDLTKALADVQKAIKAPKLRHNKFGGFDFRNTEDILQAVKPLLGEHVILLSDEIVLIGDRYYVKAIATFTDGKDVIERCGFAREADSKKGMDDAQVTGSASSYARKTALSGLLLLDDNRDVDEGGQDHIERITDEQVKALDRLLTDTGSDKDAFLKFAQADKLENIQATDYDGCVSAIKRAAEARKKAAEKKAAEDRKKLAELAANRGQSA